MEEIHPEAESQAEKHLVERDMQINSRIEMLERRLEEGSTSSAAFLNRITVLEAELKSREADVRSREMVVVVDAQSIRAVVDQGPPEAPPSNDDVLAQQPAQSSHRVRLRWRRAATAKSDADNTATTSDQSLLSKRISNLTRRIEAMEDTNHALRARLKTKGAEEASPEEPDVDISGLVNTYAVATVKVFLAHDTRTCLEAFVWVCLALATGIFQVMLALAMSTSLSWGKCHGASDCKLGQACISFINDDGSVLAPACEDCYFLVEHGGASIGDLWPNQYDGPGSEHMNASQFCLQQLDAFSPVFQKLRPEFESSFARCLYVQAAYLSMSQLEETVLFGAMFVVALACAQRWFEWSRLSWLRCRCLPCTACPSCRDAPAILKWSAAWVLRLLELFSMRMVIAALPMCMLLMLFAGGVDSVSILLNGVSVVFILTVDNFLPPALLNTEALQQVADVLATAATRAMPEDGPSTGGQLRVRTAYRAHMRSMLWGSRATALTQLVVLQGAFLRVGGVKCEMLIHTLYYRVAVSFGLWCNLLVRSIVNGLIAAFDTYARGQPNCKNDASDARVWALSWGARALDSFTSTLVSAILLNVAYWYCINVLYYADSKALDLFGDYVLDVFGLCAVGPPWNGACQPFPFTSY